MPNTTCQRKQLTITKPKHLSHEKPEKPCCYHCSNLDTGFATQNWVSALRSSQLKQHWSSEQQHRSLQTDTTAPMPPCSRRQMQAPAGSLLNNGFFHSMETDETENQALVCCVAPRRTPSWQQGLTREVRYNILHVKNETNEISFTQQR